MYRLASQLGNKLHAALRVPALAGHRVQVCAFSDSPTGEGEGLAADLTVGERKIINKLREEFPSATHIQVEDVSGGCGAMYQISIESPEFAGKRTIQQHRMVNNQVLLVPLFGLTMGSPTIAWGRDRKFEEYYALMALKEEIKGLHGFQLQTKAPVEEEGI